MTGGITRVQRDILETLDEAKAVAEPDADGRIRLANGVYDLHASLRYLSRRAGGARLPGCGDGPLPTSVARAVRGLIRLGCLVPSTASGQDDWDAFRRPHGRCRFVRRAVRNGDSG